MEKGNIFLSDTFFLRYGYRPEQSSRASKRGHPYEPDLPEHCHQQFKTFRHEVLEIVNPPIIITFGQTPFSTLREEHPEFETYNFRSQSTLLYGNNNSLSVYRNPKGAITKFVLSFIQKLCTLWEEAEAGTEALSRTSQLSA